MRIGHGHAPRRARLPPRWPTTSELTISMRSLSSIPSQRLTLCSSHQGFALRKRARNRIPIELFWLPAPSETDRHRKPTGIAPGAPPPFRHVRIQFVPEALRAKAVSRWFRGSARRYGLDADASHSPPQASRRVEYDEFIGHPLHSSLHRAVTIHDAARQIKMPTIPDILRVRNASKSRLPKTPKSPQDRQP